MSDVEWQLHNWYNFTWLSGDGLVEQACHSVDKIAWAMNGVLPLKAVATGGRQFPNNEGNIFDHIDVFYEFPDGVRAFMAQRQINGCYSDNSDYLMCADGVGNIKGWSEPTGSQHAHGHHGTHGRLHRKRNFLDPGPEFRAAARARQLDLGHDPADQTDGHAGKNAVCLTILRDTGWL
ncbi:MAG: hypothetical protein ACYSWQ_29450 [Planctomycetota bacterium]|jgi:predicted dehydrogenase